jgi:hypothetical protein
MPATGKRTVTCSKCGNKGHLAKTCTITETPDKAGERDIDKTARLTEEHWDDIKSTLDDGISIGAQRLSYPQYEEQEMRRAVEFETFADYQASNK